jgi:hypothetical protein
VSVQALAPVLTGKRAKREVKKISELYVALNQEKEKIINY